MDLTACLLTSPMSGQFTNQHKDLNMSHGRQITSYIGVAALVLSLVSAGAMPIPDEAKIGGFAVGCQAWTFNRFSAFEAIAKTAEAGGKCIEFYPGQKLSPEERNERWAHNA